MKELDIRDISIIDAFPRYTKSHPDVLTVGCGGGRIEYHLAKLGFDVLSTDIKNNILCDDKTILFRELDIMRPDKFEIQPRDVVICAEVLEHIVGWEQALNNLIKLTKTRLIITVPVEHSFNDPGHVNHWNDQTIQQFKKITMPYSTSIQRIRTKPRDVESKQWAYLIIVDKRQKYA